MHDNQISVTLNNKIKIDNNTYNNNNNNYNKYNTYINTNKLNINNTLSKKESTFNNNDNNNIFLNVNKLYLN
jgi:hypothetical protein